MAAVADLPGPVVSAPWLAAHLDGVVVADVRWYLDGRSGRAAYEEGHLPGAVFVDADSDLAAPPSPAAGRHPLPDPDAFAGAMSAVGIGDGDPVVAYDDAGGVVAARLVWMLRVLEHPAALLDGGTEAWSGDWEHGPVTRAPARFTARPWPRERLAGIDEVAALAPAAAEGGAVVLDVRAPERYRGEREPVDPRAGHVPGAVNLPLAHFLDPATKRFLPPAELRARLTGVGVGEGSDVVVYCGSGINACHGLLAVELAGLGPGRLFPGSWSQWSSDPGRPAAVGPRP